MSSDTGQYARVGPCCMKKKKSRPLHDRAACPTSGCARCRCAIGPRQRGWHQTAMTCCWPSADRQACAAHSSPRPPRPGSLRPRRSWPRRQTTCPRRRRRRAGVPPRTMTPPAAGRPLQRLRRSPRSEAAQPLPEVRRLRRQDQHTETMSAAAVGRRPSGVPSQGSCTRTGDRARPRPLRFRRAH